VVRARPTSGLAEFRVVHCDLATIALAKRDLAQKQGEERRAKKERRRDLEDVVKRGRNRGSRSLADGAPSRIPFSFRMFTEHELDPTPGGKSWLIPEVKKWLELSATQPTVFIEPFAGGAIVGLTVAAEGLVDCVLLSEIDADVASVWKTILRGRDDDVTWLCQRISGFVLTLDDVCGILDSPTRNLREAAFKTI
jgi:hypothetical protein